MCEAAAQFDEDQHRDVSFVARETGLSLDVVTSLAGAARLSLAFGQDVPVALFYGLSRAAGLIELRRLAAASVAELDAAARRAVAGHLVPALDDAVLTAAVDDRPGRARPGARRSGRPGSASPGGAGVRP